jgi:gliding motility-associated-like protein
MMKRVLILFLILTAAGNAFAQQVVTIAGLAGSTGSTDGTGTAARFNEPHALVADKNGNVYVADRLNHRIRKISASGVVSTFAGSGVAGSTDGQGLNASFNEPWGIAIDTLGNLYVADTKNYKVRQIDAAGNVTTLAGTGVFGTTNGPAATARFGFPAGIAVTRDGSTIYISDYNTHTIRKLNAGQVTTVAGTVFVSGNANGTGTAATFNHPYGLALLSNGNLIITDEWNCQIRMMTPVGTVSTIAGNGIPGDVNGPALSASFNYPSAVAADTLNNLFVADVITNTIRKINLTTATVSTYVGASGQQGAVDGNGIAAKFKMPTGIAYNRSGRNLWVGDNGNHTVRRVTAISTTTLTLSISGGSAICAGAPASFTISPAGLYNYTILENGQTLGTSTNGNVTVNGLTQGNHTLTAIAFDASGATASSNTLNVTVYPSFSPTITSSAGTAICDGASLTLTATTGTAYSWSNGSTAQSIVVNTAGSFTVSVTNSNGCVGSSAPMSITVQAAPVATITASTDTVCPGKTTVLTASAGSAWLWSNGANTQSITVGQGNYSVTVTGTGGCTDQSTVQSIAVYSTVTPSVTPSGAVMLIQGDTLTLTASGGTAYTWSNGVTGSTLNVTTGGTYTVATTNANGCTSSSAAVTVTLINSSNIITALGPVSFCEGESVVLSSVFPTGNQWYYEGLPVTGATGSQYVAVDSGWYYVAVFQGGNWMYSDSTLIKVYRNPDVPQAADTSVCKGNAVQLSVVSEPGLTYKWYDEYTAGNLLASSLSYTTPALTTNTTYYVEAMNGFGCISPARLDVNVNVLAIPAATFTYNVSSQSGQFTTTFNCTTINPATVYWIFGDTTIPGNTSQQIDPQFTYPLEGNYSVTLITANALGCTDTLIKTVYIGINLPAFVPTTFTPNGDGKNDVFRVRGEQFRLEEMRIYDQWGTLIYTTDSARPEWDGTVNGVTVQNGTYLYRIKISNQENQSQELNGPITVIK